MSTIEQQPVDGALVVSGGNGNHNGGSIVVQHFDDGDDAPPAARSNIAVLSTFELVKKMSEMLAHSAFVPDHLVDKSNPLRTQANCFRVALQAHNWGRNVFDVADRSYMTRGKLGYEGKLVASVVNTRAGLRGRLSYAYSGEGDERTVEVSGQFRNEPAPRTITLSVKQAKTGNEMWTKDPDQKLAYCGAIRWARRHCPEVVDGILTDDDLDVIAEQELPPAIDHAAEEAKRKDAAQEQMRVARAAAAEAAKAAAKSEPATVASPSPASQPAAKPTTATKAEAPDPNATLVSAEAKAEIVKLFKSSDMTEAEFDAYLSKCEAEKLSCLTVMQASQLKGELLSRQRDTMTNARTEVKPDAVNAAPAAKLPSIVIPAPNVVQNPGEMPFDRDTQLYTQVGSLAKAQHARIAELTKSLPPTVWPVADQKAFLASWKVPNFGSLSNYLAHHLIAELEKRLAGEKGLTGTAHVPASTPAA